MEPNHNPLKDPARRPVPASAGERWVRRCLAGLFILAGMVFLWMPTRWWMETQERYGLFRETALPAPAEESRGQTGPGLLEKAFSPQEADASDAARKSPRPVTFRLLAPAAREVFLGGSFNSFNAQDCPLKPRPDGVWEITLDLLPGDYSYKFKVDGRWELDPTNPEKTPEPHVSSILRIR